MLAAAIWQRFSLETFSDRAISHAIRLEEKEERVFTLPMSQEYRYKAKLNLILRHVRYVITLGIILNNSDII